MTTRIAALTVILDGEPRDDDLEPLLTSIRQLRGVADVVLIEHTGDMHLAEQRATIALRNRIMTALHAILD